MPSTLLSKPVPENMANFTILHLGILGFQMIDIFWSLFLLFSAFFLYHTTFSLWSNVLYRVI